MSPTSRTRSKTRAAHDNDSKKGAVEDRGRDEHGQPSLAGQLPHRTNDELIKASDTDFPEPGENPEHT